MILDRPLRTRATRALLVGMAVGLAACTGSTASGSPAASSAVAASPSAAASVAASPAASAPATPSAAASASAAQTTDATAVPTSIDPCQLITNQEAGQLAGTTFGPGKESTTEGNARICTYGSGAKNVFSVEVAIAPDVATAKADEAAAQADIQSQAATLASKGMTVTQLPNFAPGTDAVLMEGTVTLAGQTVGGLAIYLLRGTTFFGFSDLALNQAPPTATAMKAEALTVLGRLP